MVPYVRAFEALSASRTAGMSPNPINMSDILAYVRMYDVADCAEFVTLIQQMDQAYLKKMTEKK